MRTELTDELLAKLAKIEGGWRHAQRWPCFDDRVTIYGADGDEVASVVGNLAIPESAEDRAELIALAPELVAELQETRAENKRLCTKLAGARESYATLRSIAQELQESCPPLGSIAQELQEARAEIDCLKPLADLGEAVGDVELATSAMTALVEWVTLPKNWSAEGPPPFSIIFACDRTGCVADWIRSAAGLMEAEEVADASPSPTA